MGVCARVDVGDGYPHSVGSVEIAEGAGHLVAGSQVGDCADWPCAAGGVDGGGCGGFVSGGRAGWPRLAAAEAAVMLLHCLPGGFSECCGERFPGFSVVAGCFDQPDFVCVQCLSFVGKVFQSFDRLVCGGAFYGCRRSRLAWSELVEESHVQQHTPLFSTILCIANVDVEMPIFCLATDLIALVAALETADHLEVGWSVIEGVVGDRPEGMTDKDLQEASAGRRLWKKRDSASS